MIIAKAATTAALILTSFFPKTNLTYTTDLSESEKQTMLNDVNRLRAKGCHCGRKYMPPVKPLIWNNRLEKAAFAHANDMERNEFFDHKGSNGSNVGNRASKAGYKWYAVGENIASGYDSFDETLLAWKDSPGHCRNLMHGGHKEMGVAQVGDIWVQDFGSPMGKE